MTDTDDVSPFRRLRRWSERSPWRAALVVVAVYVLVGLAADPTGTLGTDTGAKVATIDVMVDEDRWSPDVGYWAAEADPDGTYHPLFDTQRTSDGSWVNVTTLPMLVASRPLYDLGGYRAALLFPVLGGVATALLARVLARRLGSDRAGWRAFWLVGLTSPVAIYALDFWEHAPATALMVGAVTALTVALDHQRPWPWTLVAGAALGASATMRTETFVVGFVAVAAWCLFEVRRRFVAAAVGGAAAVVGFAGPWLANRWLESALDAASRAERVGGRLEAPGRGVDVGTRVEEALRTWLELPVGGGWQTGVAFGVIVLGLLVLAVRRAEAGDDRAARLALGLVVVSYALVALGGFGFVPGALVAAPAVAFLVAVKPDRPQAFVLSVALAATPLIWAFQFTGGAGPQWGGRYLLATTMLLVVLGAVAADSFSFEARRPVLVASALVGVLAFGWLVVRTNSIASTFDDLAARDEDVLVGVNGFLLREGGARIDDQTWLSIGRGGTLAGALEVAERADADTVGFLTTDEEPYDLDADHVGSDPVTILGNPYWVHRYTLTPDPDVGP